MEKTLHILRSVPDRVVEDLIETMTAEEWATVVPLYEDDLTHTPVDWNRIVDDIFSHERVICWW